ncbi:MAG: ParB/RepB/Spo0J family partition protein [Oscillospiraceae bacterium]|jgi:ParB family chromosome partitioning protein|nr:ParB/RepB/Spo0J family partition protein [Oscillospiraceae bacterium]
MQAKKLPGNVVNITHNKIQPSPYQARRVFPLPELESLAQSIRENGVLQPLTVRAIESNRYELIAGERRLRAARMAGLAAVPCIVRRADNESAATWCLLENLQRCTLDFNEEAEGLRRLLAQTDRPLEEAARWLGISRQAAADKLELLRLPEDTRRQLVAAGCVEGHARALLHLPNAELVRRIARVICKKHLSAQDAERLVTRVLTPPKSIPVTLFKDVQIFITTIEHAVETMRASGIQSQYAKREDDECAEFVIRIPKAARGGVRIAGWRG